MVWRYCKKRMQDGKRRFYNPIKKLLNMKFGHRMFLVYFVGGLLPLIAIGFYLIRGTNQILVEQAENTELVELEAVKRQILEMQNTVTTLSQYFYFDPELEEIAEKSYTDYQEMVNDFRNYTAFLDYQKYYNNIISRISVFLKNDTLKGNMDFVVVDEETESQEWYQRVSEKGSGVVWEYLPHLIDGYDHALAMTRMLKNKKGEDVGVLVIYIRPERFEGYIGEREGTAFVTLNGETVIAGKGTDVEFSDVKEFLPGQTVSEWQERIDIEGKEYVLTCENIWQSGTKDYLQVVSVRALEEILAEANEHSLKSIYISCACTIFAVLMILVSTWMFGKRIERFREQMQKAAEGNFELEKKLGGNDEISQLYDYLSIMIRDIQKLLAGIYQERIHAEQLKTKQKDAEFKMLTSQINPHFLYNTLETIRMKARVNKEYEIEELVKMLAKILRSNIQAGEKDVPIQSEIELVECYLKIQQYRFGDKIQYQIHVQEGTETYVILPLILQPIVENSIVHGLENKEDNGCIYIAVQKQEDGVVITVEDDGIGIEEEKLLEIQRELKKNRLKGEHIGICNVHHRIKLKYGEGYGVTIESARGQRTRVTIKLPGMTAE